MKPPADVDEKGNKKEDAKNKFAMKDLEYPKLELVICKRGVVKHNNADGAPVPG